MENIDYKNIELTEGVHTNTEIDERTNEIRVFKGNCNTHLRTISDEFLTINGLLRVLENVMLKDEITDFSTCKVMKLLKEESDYLQETVENFIYPSEEGQLPEADEEEDLQVLKKEYIDFLRIIFNSTMDLSAVASVLVEAMSKNEEESKMCYVLTVKMAVKRLNDIVERIVVLLKD